MPREENDFSMLDQDATYCPAAGPPKTYPLIISSRFLRTPNPPHPHLLTALIPIQFATSSAPALHSAHNLRVLVSFMSHLQLQFTPLKNGAQNRTNFKRVVRMRGHSQSKAHRATLGRVLVSMADSRHRCHFS
jgi:hypothetical protein